MKSGAWTPGMEPGHGTRGIDSGAWTPGHGLRAWNPGHGLRAWTPGHGLRGMDSGHGLRAWNPGHRLQGTDSEHGTRGIDSRGRTPGESTPATKYKSAGDFCQNFPKTARQMQICSSFPVNRYFFIKWSQNRCIFAFRSLKEGNLPELQMYFCS